MREKGSPRGLARHNGATNHKTIIATKRLKNKFRVAILRGTVIGALIAFIIGAFLIETNPIGGVLVAAPAVSWLYMFYALNNDDPMFGR